MSTFLIIAFFGYFVLAVVSILDKFILTKSVKSPAVYAFYSTIYFLALFVFVPFISSISLFDFFVSIFSGLAFGFGLWAMFKALKLAEATHISPFIGGVAAIVTILLAYIIGEKLSMIVIIGVSLLALGSILLSYEKTATKTNLLKAFALAAFTGVLFAASNVSAKYIYESYPFLSGLIYTKATSGIVGLILLFLPQVRHSFKQKDKDTGKKGLIVTADKILGVVGVLLVQLAISMGSVTVVNAMAGIQYGFIFILVVIMTKLSPRTFKEFFTIREVEIQIIALFLIIIGTIFIGFQY